MRALAIFVAALTLSACGGNSPTAPTAPIITPPVVQSIAIAIASTLIVGAPEQATATAIMSNGSAQLVTGTWSSSNAGIAGVDSSGRVTPNANGRVTIQLVSGNTIAIVSIRVVPSYQGRWAGLIRVVGCSQTGFYAQLDRCRNYPSGSLWSAGVTFTQATRDIVSGTYSIGTLQSGSFSVPIESDGAITFNAPIVSPPSDVIAVSSSWRVNSLAQGVMVGGINERWVNVGQLVGTGEMRIASELQGMARQ